MSARTQGTRPRDLRASYKRIIICCDGSWQGSDKGVVTIPSNVARMAKAIATSTSGNGGEIQQVVFYQSGVGSTTWGTMGNVAAGATGAGLDDNVLEAYYFLCNNFEPGDEIFMFGFSRGAFTVRTLCGLISQFDLIDRYDLDLFPDLYTAYKSRTYEKQAEFNKIYDAQSVFLGDKEIEEIESMADAIKTEKIVRYRVKIKVIGCFDTVGSMGIPENWFTNTLDLNKSQKFRDPELSGIVQNAFHALALDEHRRPFSPTLWHQPVEGRDEVPYRGPNLVQMWFPGVHINIGGGSNDNKPKEATESDTTKFTKSNESWSSWLGSKISSGLSAVNPFAAVAEQGSDGKTTYSNSDNEELADIIFMWMVDRCRPFLEFNESYLTKLVEDHELKLKVTRKETVARLSPSRLFGQKTLSFAYACGPIVDSFTGAMTLGASRIRSPGQYGIDSKTRSNFVDETVAKHHTNEYMHPSVRWRYFNNGDEYKSCRGLHGFKLADYTKDPSKSPAVDDKLSSHVIWEKAVPKPIDDQNRTIRVSEAAIPQTIEWEQSVGGKLVPRSAESLEYRIMGEAIWKELQNGQSFDKPVVGKSWYQ
ncbi:hypothetical protein ABW19_dt0204345 [Dactylella cylindrospora]|nr:hypothetical protein ABW19_dt0204345 [Dactylella cylindrospora]